MKKLFDLSNKETKYIIGLMSGTSLDGVDVALVEVKNNWVDTKINLLGFIEYPFPTGLKTLVIRNSVKETSNVEDISQLNFLIPRIYAEAIETLCNEINFDIEKIDLIGSHGQTIHHLPNPIEYLGFNVSSTLQIGDPSVLEMLEEFQTLQSSIKIRDRTMFLLLIQAQAI